MAFSGISLPRVLNLTDNEMEILRAGAFLHTPLAELDLSSNPGLDVAPGALASLGLLGGPGPAGQWAGHPAGGPALLPAASSGSIWPRTAWAACLPGWAVSLEVLD